MCCAWRAARAGCVYSGTRRHFALRPLPLACSLLPHIAPAPAPFLSTVRAAFTHAAAQSSPSGSGSTSNPASLSAGPTLAASPTTTAAWPSACRWRCAAASTSGARTASMPERYAKIKSCRGGCAMYLSALQCLKRQFQAQRATGTHLQHAQQLVRRCALQLQGRCTHTAGARQLLKRLTPACGSEQRSKRTCGTPSSSYAAARCSCEGSVAKLKTKELSRSCLARARRSGGGGASAADASTRRSSCRVCVLVCAHKKFLAVCL